MLLQSAGKLKTLFVSFGQIRDKSSGKSAEENFQSNFFNSFQKTDNSDQNLKLNFNGRRFIFFIRAAKKEKFISSLFFFKLLKKV